jgi:outer membrane PBP1 activator LpoA protein
MYRDISMKKQYLLPLLLCTTVLSGCTPPTPEEIAAREAREKQAIALEQQKEAAEQDRLKNQRLIAERDAARAERTEQMKAGLKTLEEHPELMNEILREQAER